MHNINLLLLFLQPSPTALITFLSQAFPEFPWVFIYRNSVQTMMSHLDPLKGSRGGVEEEDGLHCSTSNTTPSLEVLDTITYNL